MFSTVFFFFDSSKNCFYFLSRNNLFFIYRFIFFFFYDISYILSNYLFLSHVLRRCGILLPLKKL